MQEIHPRLKLPCPPPFSTAAMSALLDLPADTSSTTTASYKKPAHRRDTSDELDVFEAASYYSGVDDTSFRSGILPYRSMNIEERRSTALGGGGGMRKSVDAPISRAAPPLPPQSQYKTCEKPTKEKETTTTKQPISPGGRLASFLNSFFNQGSSKKKSKSISATSSSTTQQYDKDGDHLLESPRGRRKRRSSISTHSRSSTVGRSSEPSFFSSSGSGFRTPTLVFPRGKAKEDPPRTGQAPLLSGAAATFQVSHDGMIRSCGYGDLPWGRSRRASTNGFQLETKGGCSYYGADKSAVLGGDVTYCGGVAEKKWVLNEDSRGIACRDLLRAGGADGALAKERSLWRSREEDGGESDSSSDLFELPNCDLQVHDFASGLPVYETTSMEGIKRGSSSSMASVAL